MDNGSKPPVYNTRERRLALESKSLTTGGLVKTSITVDPKQLARLDQAAKDRTVHRSQLLRIAIDNLLQRLNTGSPLYPELSDTPGSGAA